MTNTPAPVYVIRNARVVTVSGADIENGAVVIRGGRIAAVGASVTAPAGAQEIDARGLSVYPGMIDLGTNIGLTEISSGAPGTVDTQELGDMNPNAAAVVGRQPAQLAHRRHARRGRDLRPLDALGRSHLGAGRLPQPRRVEPARDGRRAAGRARHQTSRAWAAEAAGFAAFLAAQQGVTADALAQRDRRVEELRRMFRDALKPTAARRTPTPPTRSRCRAPRPTCGWRRSSPYARGERPVIFRAERDRDIRAAVRFADEMKLKAVIIGGSESWKAAQFLKERNVPVILDSVLNMPLREDDAYDSLFENASKLQAAGVRFCISTGDSGAHVRDLPFHAGMAAAYGLPKLEALKAVTLYPAQILGVADRVGSIEVGKIANLVVTDGDLLEARTRVRHLFIAGRQIPLVSRHTMLYDQFKDRK